MSLPDHLPLIYLLHVKQKETDIYLLCGGLLLLVLLLLVESQSEPSVPVLNNDMKRSTNVSEGCNKETVIERKGGSCMDEGNMWGGETE